jgi:hypothetical protein
MFEPKIELPAMNVRLLPGSGVLIVEPLTPASPEDFLRLNDTIYMWTLAHGKPRGFVLQAPVASGIRGISGMMSYLHFVDEYHPQAEKIAFVTNRSYLQAICRLISSSGKMTVRFFPDHHLPEAIVWAASPQPKLRESTIFAPPIPGF